MTACRSSDALYDWPLAVAAGILAAHLFNGLPTESVLVTLSCLPLAGLVHASLRRPALVLAALCWALWTFQYVLQSRVTEPTTVRLTGFVASVPDVQEDLVRFLFVTARQPGGEKPQRLLVSWYRDAPSLRVGQRWELELGIKPPWGSVNFQGSDKERWLFAERIGALATVRSGVLIAQATPALFGVERMRESVGASITEKLSDHPMSGVVLALATADRSRLGTGQRQVLLRTGTAHLLAISGLHVGLSALGGLWLGRLLGWWIFPLRTGWLLPRLGLLLGVGTAAFYAALAGLQVSTLRAVVMFAVFAGVGLSARSVHPARALQLAFALVLLIDPLSPSTAGFWFSFLAVAALLWFFVPRTARDHWLPGGLLRLLKAQWAVMLVLTPVTAFWFQSYSLSGLLANLVAIPWVSFLVVPFVLFGVVLLPFSADLSGVSWSVAAESAGFLFGGLARLSAWSLLFPDTQVFGRWTLMAGLLGGFLLLLPRALRLRCIGVALMLPVLVPAKRFGHGTEAVFEVLDAGQGTASILSTRNHSMVYDTGPGDGDSLNIVGSSILPALRNGFHQRRPELVIVSHGDLDHSGGLAALRSEFPEAEFLVNSGRRYGDLCHVPLQWRFDGIGFRVLHPTTGLPYLKNDSSCVISARGRVTSILLAGDISVPIEQRLVLEQLGGHKVVLVPHHGSRTSSSAALLSAANPAMAVATTRLGNRFGFPKPEVVARYRESGAEFWSTGACGALRFHFQADGAVAVESARRENRRIWRWPAAADCP